jgi:hypothetical protein
MTSIRRSALALLVGGAMFTGAVVGAIGFSATGANAATTPTSGATRNADASAAPGTFVSNEDPAHEATESAEREAQEDAGQRPTAP